MSASRRETLEKCIRDCQAQNEFSKATTTALDGYGPEVFGYLLAILDNRGAAEEVFSIFAESLWVALPKFRWQSSFRTWAYSLARHALARFHEDPHRKRATPLSQHPELSNLQAQLRTRTRSYLRTEVKNRMTALRSHLSEEDQTLLILHVDRGLSFPEVATVLLGDDANASQITRKTAALRKRFERVKERLRKLAKNEGMLE